MEPAQGGTFRRSSAGFACNQNPIVSRALSVSIR